MTALKQYWNLKHKLQIHPLSEGRIECSPYPFDEDNLAVPVVVTDLEDNIQTGTLQVREYRVPQKIIIFTFQKPK